MNHRAWTLHFHPGISFHSVGFPLEAIQGSTLPLGHGIMEKSLPTFPGEMGWIENHRRDGLSFIIPLHPNKS